MKKKLIEVEKLASTVGALDAAEGVFQRTAREYLNASSKYREALGEYDRFLESTVAAVEQRTRES